MCDVGPRDGLQNEAPVLSPALRAELAGRLAAAGLPRVEAASFVNPRAVPQMAHAEDVFAALPRDGATRFAALVLNERGLDRALAAGAEEIHYSYGVTDGFSLRNQNATVDEAATIGDRIVARSRAAGRPVSVTLSVAFGCPFEGRVDPGVVLEQVRRLGGARPDELLLADTIGVATPRQVASLVSDAAAAVPGLPIGLHLHNTRNTGYANAYAGLESGATLLDASIGGLGGCPFAPRATGNIATEDLVYLLDGLGVSTGVELDALVDVAHWLAGVLGRDLPGLVHRAGPFPAVAADGADAATRSG